MKVTRLLSLFLLSGLAFFGCNDEKSLSSISLPSETTGGPVSGVPAEAGAFRLTAEFPSWMKVHLQQLGTAKFSKTCEIKAGSDPTDLKCILHVKELDLYTQEFNLKINAPKEICDYLVQAPYWYYDRMAGMLPVANVTFDYNTTTEKASNCPAGFTPSGKYCQSTVPVGGYGGRPHVKFGGDRTVECAFDYTDSDGPNCCEGFYSFTVNETDGTAPAEAVLVEGKYSGKMSNCSGGPATTNNWPVNKAGFPVGVIQEVPENGTVVTYKINAAIDETGLFSNVFAANFYDYANNKDKDSESKLNDLTTNYPDGLSPITAEDVGALAPNRAYEYLCLNRAMEVKHRIRLYVNEWDTSEAFDTYLSSSGSASVSPDTPGQDGIDCATSESINVGNCNDVRDWDDYGAGTYPTEK